MILQLIVTENNKDPMNKQISGKNLFSIIDKATLKHTHETFTYSPPPGDDCG